MIKSGFCKVRIYPFDATAIKPITASQVMISAKDHNQIDTATQEAVENLNELSCSSGTSYKENISFIEDQATLFKKSMTKVITCIVCCMVATRAS